MGRHAQQTIRLLPDELASGFVGPWGQKFPPLLTVEQAAELLQVSVNSMYHLRSEGRLDGTFSKVAGKLRFHREKLFRLVCERGA
ncbi:MAG: helix-turn-helix domain-containing protein [Planctomycetaceae bacterium]|nr:helix-turn-helix domain-containing protein [Planctomycetaceae bacterium]